MSVTGFVHVNINCSDFDRSLKFYELLGFQRAIDVPAHNTAEVAAAVGMSPYTVKGALLILRNAKMPLMIDLLEWPQRQRAALPASIPSGHRAGCPGHR